MSWMDSWSRPAKSQAIPVPYYLLPGGESTPYCRSCGRVINSRRTNASGSKGSGETPSYCSQRCRNTKPRKLDREIEATFVRMLSGEDESCGTGTSQHQSGKPKPKPKAKKGDQRIFVLCDDVETAVFGDTTDPGRTFGRRKNRASRVIQRTDDEDDDDIPNLEEEVFDDGDSAIALNDEPPTPSIDANMIVRSGPRIRPPQHKSLVNGSVGGEKGRAERGSETEEDARRRLEGQRRAQRREMVRCAARRGVVFGFVTDVSDSNGGGGSVSGEKARIRKCEAVMQGKVVEPSFAKGSWGVRWRE